MAAKRELRPDDPAPDSNRLFAWRLVPDSSGFTLKLANQECPWGEINGIIDECGETNRPPTSVRSRRLALAVLASSLHTLAEVAFQERARDDANPLADMQRAIAAQDLKRAQMVVCALGEWRKLARQVRESLLVFEDNLPEGLLAYYFDEKPAKRDIQKYLSQHVKGAELFHASMRAIPEKYLRLMTELAYRIVAFADTYLPADDGVSLSVVVKAVRQPVEPINPPPADKVTKGLGKAEAARFMGITEKKLNKGIAAGTIQHRQITRQSHVFNIDAILPKFKGQAQPGEKS